MTKTGSELPQGGSFGLNSGRMKLIRDCGIDLIHWNPRFVSDLRFVI
jgi:hypothetical protein